LDSSIDELKAKVAALELRIELSSQRMRTLVEAMPIGFFLITESGVIEAANPHCLVIFAAQYSDFRAKSITSFFANHHHLFTQSALRDSYGEAVEATARRLDGTEFPAVVMVRPFGVSPEELSAVFVDDVTKKHEIERMKQEFMAMVSHDLRTPLTSLLMTHELLETGQYGALNEAGVRGLKRAQDSIKRLMNLVNDLLDLEKIESGQLELYLELVSVLSLVEDSADAVAALLSKQRLILDIAVDGTLQAYTDRERVIQTLVNLLSNAIKFSEPGRKLIVSAELQGEDVFLRVVDEGRGIPADRLASVFERFKQVKREDGSRGTGSGLGLAICKSIVELNRGAIGVDSVEGQGSTFWFSLPASVEQYQRLGRDGAQ
jgi:PAS domain S-box-containing protein